MTDTIKTTVEQQRRTDWDSLEAELRDTIADAAELYLNGTAADLEVFTLDLNRWLAHGLATRNKDILDSVDRQTRLLAERNRIRANDAAWLAFARLIGRLGNIVLIAGDLAIGAAFGAVRSIR